MRAGKNPDDRRAVDGCMDRWLNDVEDRFSVTLTTPIPGSA